MVARITPIRSPGNDRLGDRAWVSDCIAAFSAEGRARPETPMQVLRLPGYPGIRLLLKDESVHASGSLKHRLARSLFLYALCSGKLRRGQAAIDASSGSTAISEAWFARRLGIPFIAVMPAGTAIAKQREILALGARCELVDDRTDPATHARTLAAELGACYLDQFDLAASATDWRGNNNIAQSILTQCRTLGADDPEWIVCGAGTGGTSSTIGRYLRYVGSTARLCVAEPAGAAFARGWRGRDRSARAQHSTCIEGIGRRRVETCFAFELADDVVEVADVASIAAAWQLEAWLGRRYGGSSGTNLAAALRLAADMKARGQQGDIVLLLCDSGDRYADTLFEPAWLATHGFALAPWIEALVLAGQTGRMPDRAGLADGTPAPG